MKDTQLRSAELAVLGVAFSEDAAGGSRAATSPTEVSGRGAPCVPDADGRPTVLLVEDEADVLELLSQLLAVNGYHVLAARDGMEALEVARSHPGAIDLLATDIVMPRLGGVALAGELRRVRRDAKVLYFSGYHAAYRRHCGGNLPEELVLAKPFTAQQLIDRMRQCLGGHNANSG
jgi:CheY-like chemotaxis protein